MLSPLLQKLQETLDNPGFYKPLTPEEQAELFLSLFAPKPKLFEKPTVIKGIDGVTPIKDKDYLSIETTEKLVADLSSKTKAELESIITARLSTLTNGKDAVITDELVERIAEMAQTMIVLPDFPTLLTMEPEAIRNSLELLPDGEKLAQEAIEGLPERLEALENRPSQVISGGLTRGGVLKLIEENSTGGGLPDGGTTGQVLAKASDTNGDAIWQDEEVPVWGAIGGSITDQTDLQTALDSKLESVKDIFGITVDGAGNALTTGIKGFRYIEQDCVITGWDVRSDVTGSIIFDVKRNGVSIAGTEKPTISTASSGQDTTLTTWTTSLSTGDIIEFTIDSVATITRATLTILITKT